MATLILVAKVLIGFESRPVEQPATRWVIVADQTPNGEASHPDADAESETESGVAVETEGENPAA
jgi:hypothetical protein